MRNQVKDVMIALSAFCAVLPLSSPGADGAQTLKHDLVIYGSTSAGIAAGVRAQRDGLSVVVIEPTDRIGGLTTGGLGQTDIGNKSAFRGIALEFYRDIARYYRDERHWKYQRSAEYFPDGQCASSRALDSMWTFEPSAALSVLEEWVKTNRLEVCRNERLDRRPGGVVKANGRIIEIRMESGRVFSGKLFIDATYEGDLMAAAGVEYAVGREDNSKYGETLNGSQPRQGFHKLNPGIDPYRTKGDPSSGRLPGIDPEPLPADGTGDRRVQAYCYRMCLTDVPENRIPFKRPEGYDERDYELLFRNLAAEKADSHGLPWINSRMPNRKTDTNNRTGVSTDFIGANWNYAEASYSERETMLRAHLNYQRGLMWTLANHPRVPEKIRREVSRWGTCKDEFADGFGDGWQRQLYVREARRMVGEYVMTEHECRHERIAPKPIAKGAYAMDSHHVRRYIGKDGFVQNEGDVEVDCHRGPYGIAYGSIVPKRGQCSNLLVPVCLSASHIAYGSIRMEPVFFSLGEAAAAAAALACEANVAVQDVDYGKLSVRLGLEERDVPQGPVAGRDPLLDTAPRCVWVAAANTPAREKRNAKIWCSGTNDEATINAAIESLSFGGTVRLLDGDYYIDSFPYENQSAIYFGFNGGRARTVTVSGTTENKSYNTRFGAVLHVTAKALASVPTSGSARVFYGCSMKPKAPGAFFTYTHVNNINLENFYIMLQDASKPIRGIDCSHFGSSWIRQVGIYTESYFHDRFMHVKPATPCVGSIGVVSVPSSNDEMARIGYDTVNVGGLYVGFHLNGVDHLIMERCSAARCCYGYLFDSAAKTLTMINCCDEGNTHLPLFRGSGHLTCIDFNIERFNAAFIPNDPEAKTEAQATESKPGGWHGFISYTMQGEAFGLKSFWRKGNGMNFRTVNQNHDFRRRPANPEPFETWFDPLSNKTLTWNGKVWVDAMGNEVP